jgi:dihydroxyacetone kinase-like protein
MLPAEIAPPGIDVLDIDDLVAMLRLSSAWLERDEEELTALDRAIGDGDHGHNMRLGFVAVLEELDGILATGPDLGTLLGHVGLILISAVGGASGPLYGAAFVEAGLVLNGRTDAGLSELAAALEAACRGIARRGRCYPGDKTILDTLQPAADALKTALAAGLSLQESLERMQEAARQGMLSTTPLQARCGLAMRYGPRSIGHQDPGATSCRLLLQALAEAWKGRRA